MAENPKQSWLQHRYRQLKKQRSSYSGQVLYTKSQTTPERTIAIRLVMVLGVISLVVIMFWLDRGGLRDAVDGHVSFADVVYFTMVTITTVGYGDIVPVTERARLIDALFVTPIRIFVWFVFLGTAYEFVIQKVREDYRMARLQRRLEGHVVICGYGNSGRVASHELVAKGHPPEKIVVIDISEQSVREAAEDGFIGIRGDAAKESIMRRAEVGKARAVIVSPGRDDTNVLIVLTVRQLHPTVKIISSVKVEENIKLVRQGGANVTVSPSKVGGFILADSVVRWHTADYLYDLMTADGRVSLTERVAAPHEVGLPMREVNDGLVVRVQRGGEHIGFWEKERSIIQENDILVIIVPNEGEQGATPKHEED